MRGGAVVLGQPGKRIYLVRVRVTRLEAPPPSSWTRVVAVGIHWKGPLTPPKKKKNGTALSYLVSRKPKHPRTVTLAAPVTPAGIADWTAADGRMSSTCCFSENGALHSCPNSLAPWNVSFSLLKGSKENHLVEIATASVNLAEWVWTSQCLDEGEQEQRKQIPITLRNNHSAMLYVNVSFVEIKLSDFDQDNDDPYFTDVAGDQQSKREESFVEIRTSNKTHEADQQIQREEDTSDRRTTDDHSGCSTTDTYIPDLAELLELADQTDKTFKYRRRAANANLVSTSSSSSSSYSSSSSSGRPSPDSILSWKKANKKNISWEKKEFVSRDNKTLLKTQVFFASIDQLNASAGGESACSALVAVIADALLRSTDIPTRSKFDALIKQGSSEWQKLCDNPAHLSRFPNKHFDLETILAEDIRQISVSPKKSFVGFFRPESFASLRGAMSFEEIWKQISSEKEDPNPNPNRVYIVSWNDHFFLLKVEGEVYYIIDTVGGRLHEGCNRAYILRFDESTEMYSGDKLICSGKECCKGFIERFLAAITVSEALEMGEKGKGSENTLLHQRLQIEFHHAEAY